MGASRAAPRLLAPAAALLAALAGPVAASAQELHVAATADLASGLEGGATGYASGVRRARTLLSVGAEAQFPESPEDRIAAALLLEIEPHTGAGADLRYVRMATNRLFVEIGGVAILTPSTLVGVTAGAEYRLPLTKAFTFTTGPTVQVFFLGTDLPDNEVLWQGLFHVGIQIDLK
jgi:hypothetical protein